MFSFLPYVNLSVIKNGHVFMWIHYVIERPCLKVLCEIIYAPSAKYLGLAVRDWVAGSSRWIGQCLAVTDCYSVFQNIYQCPGSLRKLFIEKKKLNLYNGE